MSFNKTNQKYAISILRSNPGIRQYLDENHFMFMFSFTEHVWQVNVQKKGLGASRNILGLYHLCLTDKKLFLVKIRSNNSSNVPDVRLADTLEFSLSSIRR